MNQEFEKMYLKLQNGSDVRGVAMEGVEGEHVNLTPEIAMNIAAAFVEFAAEKCGKAVAELKVSVGHDSRLTAGAIKGGVLEGIQKMGAGAVDCSLSSTPSMFMSTILPQIDCDGAVMITASHLPFNRNGLKFFTKDGGLESKDIKVLLKRAAELAESGIADAPKKKIETLDLLSHYSANLRQIICKEIDAKEEDKPLTGMHFVVDAGNGAGGFFATQVLEPLGADSSGSVYLDPDGTFPNHIPNPEDKDAMKAISEAVISSKSDLGVIFVVIPE